MADAAVAASSSKATGGSTTQQVDVAVVGAGFAGLYLLHRLRKAGFNAIVLEEAGDVGGTWYWNRYPGARCDIQTIDYSYTFDPELETAWKWSEKYATQPEILRYLGFVTERYDLRRDIRFHTKVTEANWDQATERWLLKTDSGATISCRYYIMATGCLSAPKPPEIDGVKDFKGEVYFTGRWPHDEVKLAGKRVAVIGTGSSGIQAIPLIAEQAAQLTVFQRTPNFALPAHNGPAPADRAALLESDRATYREQARWSMAGVPWPQQTAVSWQLSDAERRERFEQAWAAGDLVYILTQLWADQGVDVDGNALVCELVREKIRDIVKDPETAAALSPFDHPFGAKRPCLDTNYYATYNRPNVTLVNLRQEPIKAITATGIATEKRTFDIDVIVFATGFDAMTGAIMAVHPITGRNGKSLSDVWANGPQTYLGLTVADFPNLFMITGPGSPSVLSNMAVSIEQHADWVVDRLIAMRDAGFTTIEATETAQDGWAQHMADCASLTLHRLANTWYTGANVPGKAWGVMPYTGGVGPYRSICNEVAGRGMLGFRLTGPNGVEQCNDGEIVRLQPDVRLVLGMLAEMNLPAIESLGAQGSRDFVNEFNKGRPAGRPVGEVGDGMLQGADGPLPYRLYRPATPGPHPIVVYFHGGGWVFGDQQSDDPFCRDMCRRTGMIFVSVGYRHAPRTSIPGGSRRWLRRDALGCRARRRARRKTRSGRGRRLERRRQCRGRHLPTGARTRRLADRRATPDMPGHRRLVRPPVLYRQCDGLFPDARADVLVLGYLLFARGPRRSARLAAARQTRESATGARRHLRVRSAARRGCRLRGSARCRRRSGRADQGPRPHPFVADDGRCGDNRRRRACADGERAAPLRRIAGE